MTRRTSWTAEDDRMGNLVMGGAGDHVRGVVAHDGQLRIPAIPLPANGIRFSHAQPGIRGPDLSAQRRGGDVTERVFRVTEGHTEQARFDVMVLQSLK